MEGVVPGRGVSCGRAHRSRSILQGQRVAGVGPLHTRKRTAQFLPFSEALTVARSHNLASTKEWELWCKQGMRPPDVPSRPCETYKGAGWQGWGHWLGTGNVQKGKQRFLPFDGALAVTQALGLASRTEWERLCKNGMRPPNVPANPRLVYKGAGWQGWGHWLGTGNTRKRTAQFLPFSEALTVARSRNLASTKEWELWCKQGMRPPGMPARPCETYKGAGWQGWGHWLGTGNVQKGKQRFLPFDGALAVARCLRLVSQKEWKLWCRSGARPHSVPAAPDQAYKDGGWQGWGHWLGTGNQAKKTRLFLPFDEALAVARSLRLASSKEWALWCKEGGRPANIPYHPAKIYARDGWAGWGHWLHTAAPAPAAARPGGKRAAAGGAGTSGKSQGKRQRH